MTADTGRLLAAFETRFGRRAEVLAEAPGRVNLIGEHTDYNGGFVLPVAIDRTVAVAASPLNAGRVRFYAQDNGEQDEFSTEGAQRSKAGGWRDYVRGM